MDINPFITAGMTGIIILVGGILYKILYHFNCKSKCCGKEASLETNISPKNSDSFIEKNPKN
jgi:hypothetical protein